MILDPGWVSEPHESFFSIWGLNKGTSPSPRKKGPGHYRSRSPEVGVVQMRTSVLTRGRKGSCSHLQTSKGLLASVYERRLRSRVVRCPAGVREQAAGRRPQAAPKGEEASSGVGVTLVPAYTGPALPCSPSLPCRIDTPSSMERGWSSLNQVSSGAGTALVSQYR